MKKKELKALARKIAKVELKLRKGGTPKEEEAWKCEMMELCSQVHSLEDIAIVDEMVLEILEKI
jgi:hypothetical protein